MDKETLEGFGIAAVSIAILVIVFGGLMWFKSAQCSSQWELSGMKSSWGVIQGCMIQRTDGTWIPAKSYREMAE